MRAHGKPGQRYCTIFIGRRATAANIYITDEKSKGGYGIQSLCLENHLQAEE